MFRKTGCTRRRTRSQARRSAQTALYRITYALVRLLAPILSFTTEEVWGYLRKPAGSPDERPPGAVSGGGRVDRGLTREQRARLENWDKLLPVREQVLKSLEAARQEKVIGAPLEARVRLSADGDLYALLRQYAGGPAGAVHRVASGGGEAAAGDLRSTVERAEASKCERCWKYLPDVGRTRSFRPSVRKCRASVKEQAGH